MKLSTIIVNYNSHELIGNCIHSCLHHLSTKDIEWIIVNNDSNQDARNNFMAKFPFVKWIDMGYNAGFARANNKGIEESSSEIVLLLNPDTLAIDNSIHFCLERFSASSHVACGIQLLNADKTPQISANYFMTGGLNHLLPLPFLGEFLRQIAFAFKFKKTSELQASSEQIADWINGAFLMVKKEVIYTAGLLDEDFFLYAEESEWCNRLGKFGTLCVYGDLNIIHLQGEVINQSTNTSSKGYNYVLDKKGQQILVSNLLYIRKKWGVFWMLIHSFFLLAEIPVLLTGFIIINLINLKNPFRNTNLVIQYIKNVATIFSYLPAMISNKSMLYKVI